MCNPYAGDDNPLGAKTPLVGATVWCVSQTKRRKVLRWRQLEARVRSRQYSLNIRWISAGSLVVARASISRMRALTG